MLTPRTRLLFWFAAVALPCSLLGAIEPGALGLCVVAVSGLVVVVLVDGFVSRRGLAGLSVQMPPVARMSKDRSAQLEIRLRNATHRPRTLHLALALPPEIQSSQAEAYVGLPPGGEWSRLNWPCLPRVRGRFRLQGVRLGTSSPLGFWDVRKTVATPSELRVYPNLLDERRDLAALFLHRGSPGLHAQRQVGKGREFEKLREYVPGDSFEEIHWKATAKRGRPITKVFQIERTQEVYVVIDASRLSARPAPMRYAPRLEKPSSRETKRAGDRAPETSANERAGRDPGPTVGIGTQARPALENSSTLERFITAGLVLGLAAQQQGDCFGLLTFTNKVENFLRAKNGPTHYSACRDALYLLEPQVVSPDFDEVCTFIRLRLRRRALLVFLTALDDPVLAESFVRNMELIRRQHLVVVNMLQPPGVAPLFSEPAVESVDDLYQCLGGHLQWQKLRELEKVLQRRGVHFSLLRNEHLSAELVGQYLGVKRRQLL